MNGKKQTQQPASVADAIRAVVDKNRYSISYPDPLWVNLSASLPRAEALEDLFYLTQSFAEGRTDAVTARSVLAAALRRVREAK
jgi:hypothetical protein